MHLPFLSRTCAVLAVGYVCQLSHPSACCLLPHSGYLTHFQGFRLPGLKSQLFFFSPSLLLFLLSFSRFRRTDYCCAHRSSAELILEPVSFSSAFALVVVSLARVTEFRGRFLGSFARRAIDSLLTLFLLAHALPACSRSVCLLALCHACSRSACLLMLCMLVVSPRS